MNFSNVTTGRACPPIVFSSSTNPAAPAIVEPNNGAPADKRLVQVCDHPYKGGTFTGTLCGKQPFEGVVKSVTIGYKKFAGVVKEGALACEGRTRFQRPDTKTPFQALLRDDVSRSAGADAQEKLRRQVLNYGFGSIELDVDQKFDVTNDNARRMFDTIFAKEMLTKIMGDPLLGKAVLQLSDNIVNVFEQIIADDVLDGWRQACNGAYLGADGRFQQLSVQVSRAKECIDALPMSQKEKDLALKFYCRRYLSYVIGETATYREMHPQGLIKSNANPLYYKRGRLDGDFALRESLNMGILRNIDQCPTDLRFSTKPQRRPGIEPGVYTRCPDRLSMADPSDPLDSDADSWLSNSTRSGMTPFVNGMSGSMLIEIGNLIFIKALLKGASPGGGEDAVAGPRQLTTQPGRGSPVDSPVRGDDFLHDKSMIAVVENYFRALAAMYVYIDGGHSLFEIQESFKNRWVPTAFASEFESDWAAVGADLYSDPEIFDSAWTQTKAIDTVIEARKQINKQVRQPVPENIRDLALRQ